jgi:ComF family protein
MALRELLAPPFCWSCSGPARRGDALCGGCRASLHRLAPEPVWLSGVRVWAPVAYAGAARDLVGALKFREAIGVADEMAAQIAANSPPEFLGGTLVPVPLHPRRLRSRGYNQAAAIAAALGERTQLPLADCLLRKGPAVTQVGRHREERRAGPAGSIEVRAERSAGGLARRLARVLLVDDVVTTGATLAACEAVLREAGAREFGAVVFARTLGR